LKNKSIFSFLLVALLTLTIANPAAAADKPAYFISSANGDLADLNKDLDDMVKRTKQNAKIRLLGNQLELSFNLGQLESLDPPSPITQKWTSTLGSLGDEIDKLSTICTDFVSGDATQSKVLKGISAVRKVVEKLKALVKKVKK